MSWTQFGQQVMSRSVKLKALLMDQTVIAGIGNIYSDEILFDAGLRYDRVSNTLSTMELRRLFRAVVETLHEAIKYGGTTLDDDQYVDLHGKAGTFGDHLRAYGRDKQACLRCRGVITKARFSQRSTYFCPDCQI
jgi:formamidopyrimidine-DNA glycosylase